MPTIRNDTWQLTMSPQSELITKSAELTRMLQVEPHATSLPVNVPTLPCVRTRARTCIGYH